MAKERGEDGYGDSDHAGNTARRRMSCRAQHGARQKEWQIAAVRWRLQQVQRLSLAQYFSVEGHGHRGRNDPADRPCAPDADGAEQV